MILEVMLDDWIPKYDDIVYFPLPELPSQSCIKNLLTGILMAHFKPKGFWYFVIFSVFLIIPYQIHLVFKSDLKKYSSCFIFQTILKLIWQKPFAETAFLWHSYIFTFSVFPKFGSTFHVIEIFGVCIWVQELWQWPYLHKVEECCP